MGLTITKRFKVGTLTLVAAKGDSGGMTLWRQMTSKKSAEKFINCIVFSFAKKDSMWIISFTLWVVAVVALRVVGIVHPT